MTARVCSAWLPEHPLMSDTMGRNTASAMAALKVSSYAAMTLAAATLRMMFTLSHESRRLARCIRPPATSSSKSMSARTSRASSLGKFAMMASASVELNSDNTSTWSSGLNWATTNAASAGLRPSSRSAECSSGNSSSRSAAVAGNIVVRIAARPSLGRWSKL